MLFTKLFASRFFSLLALQVVDLGHEPALPEAHTLSGLRAHGEAGSEGIRPVRGGGWKRQALMRKGLLHLLFLQEGQAALKPGPGY